LIGKWFAANLEKRKDVFLATKFAIQIDRSSAKPKVNVDSSPEYCKVAIEKSLKRLGLPYVDLYYVHRLDKITAIERTIEAMVELKKAGKINHIGMSECSADSLRRAHAVHPITAVQLEYNPFCLAIESAATPLLKTARELGIAVVAYCPLGHGFITGAIRTREDVMKPGDQRAMVPWLREENFASNVAIVDQISSIAEKKGVTTAQLTLAWLLAQGDDIFPIPGTKKVHRLEENLRSMDVKITSAEERAVRKAAEGVVGGRVQELLGHTFADTPPLQ
jgi:aryl-alcohol dehydrogenase-like predicted oxidoreductase